MRDRILALLRGLPRESRLEERGGSAWIRCPVHAGQTGASPPFKITLEGQYAGSGYCFSCGAHGGWRRVAAMLGLPSSARFLSDESMPEPFTESEAAAMLGRRGGRRRGSDYRERWPASQDWRGVSGRLISDVGGKMILGGDGMEPVLRLPAMVRGAEVGYVDCRINPQPGDSMKYLNKASGWSRDALYPYDFVRAMRPRVLVLVEGPRDALVTIQNGVPALATLGSTSWSDKCRRLLVAVAPSTVVLMFDPDDAGEKLRRRVYRDVSGALDVRSARLPSRLVEVDAGGGKTRLARKKIVDPADLDAASLSRVLAAVGLRPGRRSGAE